MSVPRDWAAQRMLILDASEYQSYAPRVLARTNALTP
jgi:hypothetical protein